MASKDLHKDADVKQQQLWECAHSPAPPVFIRGSAGENEQAVHPSRHNAGEVVSIQPQIQTSSQCAELRRNLAHQLVFVKPPCTIEARCYDASWVVTTMHIV